MYMMMFSVCYACVCADLTRTFFIGGNERRASTVRYLSGENCLKLELTTVVDRTSACPDGRGAANLVAASRMRLRHRIEADLVEAAVAK